MSQSKIEEPLDRCSNACTRAGVTALLTVAVAVSLSKPLPEFQDAARRYQTEQTVFAQKVEYLNLRNRLKETVEFLTIDPCYRIWTGAKKVRLELLTLRELGDIDCGKTAGAMDQFLDWALEAQQNSKSVSSPAFRLPPENLRAESQAIISEITDAILAVLNAHGFYPVFTDG